MYSSLQRLNNISTVATSCILALLGAISLSSFLLGKDAKGALHVTPIKVSVTWRRAGAHWVVWSRSVLIQTIVQTV